MINNKKINQLGVDLIKKGEGKQLEAYPDPKSELFKQCLANKLSPYKGGYKKLKDWAKYPGGPWTIGYGHTGSDVKPGLTYSEEQAEAKLKERLREFEMYVNKLVKIPLTDNQFSALVSLCYNCGPGGLIKLINGQPGPYQMIEYISKTLPTFRISEGSNVEKGLRARRIEEKQLFDKKD